MFARLTAWIAVEQIYKEGITVAIPEKVEIPLAEIQTVERLHLLLQQKLGLPESYGQNWDAFWDCLNDQALCHMPSVLVLSGWSHLVRTLPQDAKQLRQCLDDWSTACPEDASRIIYMF